MDLDQTAPIGSEQSELGIHCLPKELLKTFQQITKAEKFKG